MDNGAGKRSYVVAGTQIAARPLEPALYLVSTPIGNLGDVTIRALETLAAADLIACEDTRTTRVLLDRYGIRTKLVAYHEHNEATAAVRLVEDILTGKSVAQVSDAGTPLVSDPGYRLAGKAIEAGIRVVPIPGASALLAALTASGLPSDSFFFAGFLPARDGQRRTRLEAIRSVPGTLILYESPRRLADSLATLAAVLGARPAAIGRELTKTFEELRRGSLDELAAHYAQAETPKGEVVICVGPPREDAAVPEDTDALLVSLAAEMPTSKAAGEAARMTGRPKAELYRRLLELKAAAGG